MKAILKEIRTGYFDEFYHKITMCFSKSIESDELYFFNTSLEHQFCTDEERIAGLSEDLVEEKVCYANTLIGRWFEINLYKISIKEISNQHYIALEIFNDEECESRRFTDFRVATFMTKKDAIEDRKYMIVNSENIEGVLPDGITEEVNINFIFPIKMPTPEDIVIPYDLFPSLNTNYIIQEASLEEMANGYYLANQLNESKIDKSDFNNFIKKIKEYRENVMNAQIFNNSFVKKLFFWIPPKKIKDIVVDPDMESLAINSIILFKQYPVECKKAEEEYWDSLSKFVRKKFLHEDVEEEELFNRWQSFHKEIRERYKDKFVIKIVD